MSSVDTFDQVVRNWFVIEERIRTNTPMQGVTDRLVDLFPEPMMQSWLRVLQWWWSGNFGYMDPLRGTRLWVAAQVAVQPKREEADPADRPVAFIDSVCKLHDEKDAAYGTSWKKRGEMLGIMANLARKIDRLGKNGGGDTAADTAIDLLVYLAKYRMWLVDHAESPTPVPVVSGLANYSDGTKYVNALLRHMAGQMASLSWAAPSLLEEVLTASFENLEHYVEEKREDRWKHVETMMYDAYALAAQL